MERPSGRGHRVRRHNVTTPSSEFLFLQTPLEELDDDMHFQFMQQAIKDVKDTGDCTPLGKSVTGLVFNQMSANASLKKHREKS
jgi:hypothetical protein